jgi:hypothetical protein
MNAPVKPNGGMATLLTTLASGDNVSKMLMVVLIFMQGGGIWNVNRNGNETRAEVEQQQRIAFKQLKNMYDSQKIFIQAIKDANTDHNELMKKLGIKMQSQIKVPPQPTPPEEEEEP